MAKHTFLIGLTTLLLFACASLPTMPGPHPTAPSAGDQTSRQVVATAPNFVTMLPASPSGAAVGIDYEYTMPMCGALGPIDVDGSFWEVADAGVALDGRAGVFRLLTYGVAQFTREGGPTVRLTRHEGAMQFRICS